jgi:hypothetical protein
MRRIVRPRPFVDLIRSESRFSTNHKLCDALCTPQYRQIVTRRLLLDLSNIQVRFFFAKKNFKDLRSLQTSPGHGEPPWSHKGQCLFILRHRKIPKVKASFLSRSPQPAPTRAVIPSNRSRSQAIPYDKEIYKDRNLEEWFINKISHYRRIATRYEKIVVSCAAVLFLVATMTWLK